MAEALIVALACLSMAVILGALVTLIVNRKRALRRDTKWLLAGLLIISFLHGASNLCEWMSVDHPSEPLEDFFLLLLPAIWGSFFYAFLQEQSRAELQESEGRYRSLTNDVLDTTAAGICILDAQRHVVWVNQALEDFFGLKRREIVGRQKIGLVEERLKHMVEDPQTWAAGIRAIFESEASVNMECHIMPGARRQERWLEYRTQPIRTGLYAGGRIEHYYDITERKRAAQQRELLLEKLESQKAELERFTYTVSHDLKSPLITIKGFLGVVEENLAAGSLSETRKDLQRIENAANRMERLLEELLELSRIGRDGDSAELVELADIVADTLEMVYGKLEQRGVAVQVHGDLPAVWGQRARLLEVVQNLIDNAIKYMGDQPHPRIQIGTQTGDRETLCFVRDNGIGIEDKYLHKVFNLFEQLDPKADGTGIGLAVVKRIVDVHGGRIWVESEGVGQGATFWFALPTPQSSVLRRVEDS